MGYRVSATNKAGGVVSIIVSDAAIANATINEYREDGFAEITLTDLEGNAISIETLSPTDASLAQGQ